MSRCVAPVPASAPSPWALTDARGRVDIPEDGKRAGSAVRPPPSGRHLGRRHAAPVRPALRARHRSRPPPPCLYTLPRPPRACDAFSVHRRHDGGAHPPSSPRRRCPLTLCTTTAVLTYASWGRSPPPASVPVVTANVTARGECHPRPPTADGDATGGACAPPRRSTTRLRRATRRRAPYRPRARRDLPPGCGSVVPPRRFRQRCRYRCSPPHARARSRGDVSTP